MEIEIDQKKLMWWCTWMVPAFGRPRQENREFQTNYTARSYCKRKEKEK